MKLDRRVLALAAVALLLVVGACSTRARVQEQVVLPAMLSTWPGLVEDARAAFGPEGGEVNGVDLEQLLGDFREALVVDDRAALQELWPNVKIAVNDGIVQQVNRGELDEVTAISVQDRLHWFDEAVRRLGGTP